MTAPTFRLPEIVPKGWGREVILANLPLYCGKLLCFTKGQRFSSHFHDLKNESFYVLSGRIRFSHFDPANADKLSRELGPGEVVDIPRLCVHQVEAIEESVVIEVSTHHEDSDSYRVEKGASQMAPRESEWKS